MCYPVIIPHHSAGQKLGKSKDYVSISSVTTITHGSVAYANTDYDKATRGGQAVRERRVCVCSNLEGFTRHVMTGKLGMGRRAISSDRD